MFYARYLCFAVMNTRIELRHLQALVAVAEEGTFTDAGIRLGISQSAVSRTIVAFEQVVDAHLVERTTRSVALTERGAETYRAAVVALGAVADAVDAGRGRTRALRLGYAWSALGRYTGEVLRCWRAEHPDIALEVHRVDERTAGLVTGSVDVAVIRGHFDDPAFVVRLIFREPRVAALPTEHPLVGRPSIALSDLVDDVVLITATGTTTLDLWPANHRPRSTLRVDNIDEWITEISGGLAVGVTAESTAAQHSHPGIRFVPVVDVDPVPVYLAWPAHRIHLATPAFVQLVRRIVDGH
jgi:DNA-binding transcriptional LysR family regulator